MYEDRLEHVKTLLVDLVIVLVKSIYYLLETLYLTVLPNRFRKLKVIDPPSSDLSHPPLNPNWTNAHFRQEFNTLPERTAQLANYPITQLLYEKGCAAT